MVAARQALEQFFPILIEQYGNVAAVVASDWYEDVYAEVASMAPGAVDAAAANTRLRWGIGAAFGGDKAQALATLGTVTDELVKQFGRDTIVGSAVMNGRSYARVPTGAETCAFCMMLASRGFVYESERGAGGISKFHGDCDCAIVAEDGVVPDGYDPDALYEKYLNAHNPGDSTKETLRNMRDESGVDH